MASIQQTVMASPRIGRLRDFVVALSELVESAPGEPDILLAGSRLLKDLVAVDDWLPARYAEPSVTGYQQYLLHTDSRERFSVVSFVWGPGQESPIHDHTVWGIVGVLRRAEIEQRYSRASDGRFEEQGPPSRLEGGEVTAVSPAIGDSIASPRPWKTGHPPASMSTGPILAPSGDPCTKWMEQARRCLGYSNTELPNLWDRSKDK